MSRATSPVAGLVLTLLRSVRQCTQKELAARTGTAPAQISEYEKGRRRLTREKLDELLAPLELDESVVDLAFSAVSLLCSLADPEEAQAVVAGLSPAEMRRVSRFSARMARALGDLLQREAVKVLQARRLATARENAAWHCKCLLGRPPAERRLLLEDGFHLQTWAVSVWLSEESERAAVRNAAEALELAGLGLRAAELAFGDATFIAGLKGHAWSFLGNAHRVAGNLLAADAAFATARAFWCERADACSGVLAEWRIDDLEASLRRDQRQWSAALDLLDRAGATVPPEIAGRILIKKATVLEQAGEFDASLATLDEANRLLDVKSEPHLGYLVRFNQIVCLCHLGRFQEAEVQLRHASAVAIELDNGLDLVRVLWLRGRVASGLGRKHEARDALERVRSEFVERGNGAQAALVCLELAILDLEEGRTAEVRELAQSVVGIFKSQRIEREAAAALRLFYEAAEAETVTIEQVRRLHAFLEGTHTGIRLASEKVLSFGAMSPTVDQDLSAGGVPTAQQTW